MVFRQIMIWLVVIAALVGGFFIYQHKQQAFFTIAKVKIKSDFHYLSKRELTDTIAPFLNQGFLAILPTKIQHILERKPWVKKARVVRRWPDTLEIAVIERQPWLRFNDKLLIDSDGEVFAPTVNKPFGQLPQLSSSEQFSSALLQEYKKISKILSRVSLFVKKLEKTDATITIVMKNGMTLVTSYPKFSQEIERFVIVYPSVAEEKQSHLALIDLRYQHGMAVQWK